MNPYVEEGKLLSESQLVYAIKGVNLDNVTVKDFVLACKNDAKEHNEWGTITIVNSEYEFGRNNHNTIDKIPSYMLDSLIDSISGYSEWGYHRNYIIKLKED